MHVVPADIVFRGSALLDAGNCPIRLLTCESPHTEDSTLIHVPGERVLFLGDAGGGTFPTWEKDAELCRKLADTIAGIDADICLESHWEPQSRQSTVSELMQEGK